MKVDWGDGSTPQTYTGENTKLTITHQYKPTSYPASYDITFKVNRGKMWFPTNIMGNSMWVSYSNQIGAWNNMIEKVSIGNNVTQIMNYVFENCYSLASITIPSSVTSIGDNVF